MWGLDSLGLPINAADGTVTLPFWAAAVAAALLLVFFILALVRTGLAGTLVFVALVGFGIWAAWTWSEHERVDQRRALEGRLAGLEAQALVPGSNLPCLDAAGGETIEAGCERAIFAGPETLAAAASFTMARLLLLQDGLAFAERRDATFENTLQSLRKALEGDRYGVLAQVLTVRNGCSAERCEALRLLRDPARVRANMRDRTFETIVSRHAAAWAARAASVTTVVPNSAGAIPGTVAAPVPPRYTLPSAASIPPVNIMTNEPTANAPAAPPPAAESPATAAAPPTTPPRRPARPAPPRTQAGPPATSAPIPLAPTPPPRPQ